jgi:hypothetical protein
MITEVRSAGETATSFPQLRRDVSKRDDQCAISHALLRATPKHNLGSMATRVDKAVEQAEIDAASTSQPAADGRARTLELVMGDPQAPFDKVLAVLDHHGLLGDDGRLSPDVALVSIGDHFDYGGSPEPGLASVERSGRLLLSWLAAHPPDQVALIVGNHDLGRVGELAAFDDEKFARARAAAVKAKDDPELEKEFLEQFPELPSSEVARRDFNGFSVTQRELVARLLRAGRFLAAHARDDKTLLCHAGVTVDDLDAEASADAPSIARWLNDNLQRAVQSWREPAPLVIRGLHHPGNAEQGEGGGIFYHRPCHPAQAGRVRYTGPFRRRYDPRRLPPGVVQVIGHIRDNKCRELLGEWVSGPEARDGELRHLVASGRGVSYAAGSLPELRPGSAAIVFTDGGMNYTKAEAYELLDLRTMQAYR